MYSIDIALLLTQLTAMPVIYSFSICCENICLFFQAIDAIYKQWFLFQQFPLVIDAYTNVLAAVMLNMLLC